MINNDLYNKVLLEPVQAGANKLYVVSGYASPALAFRHLKDVPNITVKLIVGMTPREGLGKNAHSEFVKLVNSIYPGRFECYYLTGNTPVHTKAYAWFCGSSPILGYTGSANYSQNAFFEGQGEAVSSDSAESIKSYFDSLMPYCIPCIHENIESYVALYDENLDKPFRIASSSQYTSLMGEPFKREATYLSTHQESITLTLLTQSQDRMPEKSGLNWGQRNGREHNQAYISLPSPVYSSNFFPEPGKIFNLITDDNFIFNCVRAQANGKAIETPDNNSLLGIYFRNRIGVPLGSFVTMDNLLRYGRTSIKITKINTSTYYMDFSV